MEAVPADATLRLLDNLADLDSRAVSPRAVSPLAVVSPLAIAALRAFYTLIARAVASLPYLRPAVALILGFVGLKMAAEYFHIHISSAASLGFITLALVTGPLARLAALANADAPEAAEPVEEASGASTARGGAPAPTTAACTATEASR